MIAGLLIGIGMILPGVSGGVIAVIIGVYDSIIDSLYNFKKNKRKNLKFLFLTFIGIIIGAIIGGKLLFNYFDKYYVELCYLFIGLVIGSIPKLIKDINEKGKINYIVLLISIIISLIIGIISKKNIINVEIDYSIIKLFLMGLLFILGKTIPGVSSTILLVMIGMYKTFLSIISNPVSFLLDNFYFSIIIILGVIIGLIISVKIMFNLLKKYYSITNSIIVGLVIGSLIILYPNEISLIGLILLILGIIISFILSKINKK